MALYERGLTEAMKELDQVDDNQAFDRLLYKHERLVAGVQRALFELDEASDPYVSKTVVIINVRKILEAAI